MSDTAPTSSPVDGLSDRMGKILARVVEQMQAGIITEDEVVRSLNSLLHGSWLTTTLHPQPHSWKKSPSRQVEQMRRYAAKRDWGLEDARIPVHKYPDFEPTSPWQVLTLCVYLPDRDGVPGYIRTFVELMRIVHHNFKGSVRQSHLLNVRSEGLKLHETALARHQPGYRWAIVDFGANWNRDTGICADDIERSEAAGSEALSALALMPGFLRTQQGGLQHPRLTLAGYMARRKHQLDDAHAWVDSDFSFSPSLWWDMPGRKLEVRPQYRLRSDPCISLPTVTML